MLLSTLEQEPTCVVPNGMRDTAINLYAARNLHKKTEYIGHYKFSASGAKGLFGAPAEKSFAQPSLHGQTRPSVTTY